MIVSSFTSLNNNKYFVFFKKGYGPRGIIAGGKGFADRLQLFLINQVEKFNFLAAELLLAQISAISDRCCITGPVIAIFTC